MDIKHALKFIKEQQATYVDLRFTDTRGVEQHVTIPAAAVDQEFFEQGKMFDGSSIAGWKGIHESDMILMPDPSTIHKDPFFAAPTVLLRCDIVEPKTMEGYDRDPRSVAKRAEQYLKETGIADTILIGPEPEFFVFDDVRWETGINQAFYSVDSQEGIWNSGKEYLEGNMGQRPKVKGGYFPLPPIDSGQDLRSEICDRLGELGMVVETHHHEVATGGQYEIGFKLNTLCKKADNIQLLKYTVRNVAAQFGKTATFMPKPLIGDNGTGMHVHQSLGKSGVNLFAGDESCGLSQMALYYIGGIIKHGKAINAFTNASTNSYKRLTPGFEAPTILAYSARNRSVAIRIPFDRNPKNYHIEVRFPDSCGNPYLSFAAMLMAGLDGIKNKIDPGLPMDEDAFELSREEVDKLPSVAITLGDALNHLRDDHDFLLQGDVFSKEFIDSYIELKEKEVDRLRNATHPVEFEMYYTD
jgi:glutamine synthetase